MATKTKTTAPTRVNLSDAPPISAGEQINLSPLRGRAAAIYCTERVEQKTRFGDRQMTTAVLIVAGEETPLKGVFFQAYFQKLELKRWYAGIIERPDRAWGLSTDAMESKDYAALDATISVVLEAHPELL